MELSAEDLHRFSRQISLPGVGMEGQRRLRSASVVVIGAGGLGSPALLYLAAAGIGTIRVVDDDAVDLSNLHRQILHTSGDLGTRKVDSASGRLREIDPSVTVEPVCERMTAANARELIRGFDLVIDGSDNFPTRYLVTDASYFEQIPVIYGSVFRYEGQVSVFNPPHGPCYRCVYPAPPPEGMVPSCEEGGVLGVVPGVVGVLQATEALKLILGQGDSLMGRLLLVDLLGSSFRAIRLRRNEQCALCGPQAIIRDVQEIDWSCATGETMNEDITPAELNERIKSGDRPRLVDVREGWEWELAHLEGAEHIPMAALPARVGELDPGEEVVVYCRSGGRSDRAAQWLRQNGFVNARNLTGGILRWSSDVDPSIPRY